MSENTHYYDHHRTVQDAFAEIVAGLDESLPCGSVFPCDGEAVWWGNVHGCERAAICTTHMMRWVEDSSRKIAEFGYVHCGHCGGIFTTVGRLGTFRPL